MPDNARGSSRRLALFNHKGGVGKTTLTINIAAALADMGKRILLVDSDPQCNLTSYLFEESVVDSLLDESDSTKGRTLWTALKPIVNAEGNFDSVEPYETSINNLWLLPGDIRLAEYELSLHEFWQESLVRRIKGFRGVNSLSGITSECAKKIKADYIFYDTGPNIGPLNRAILLDCDYFIIPAACDLFSIRALKSLGHTMSQWIQDWKTILSLAPSELYMMPGLPRFLGYIPQRFKIYSGRKSSIASNYVSRIEKTVFSDVVSILRKIDPALAPKSMAGTKLGEVKDFSSLVQLSQGKGVPISEVPGGQQYQKEQAKQAFDAIANSIIKKTENP